MQLVSNNSAHLAIKSLVDLELVKMAFSGARFDFSREQPTGAGLFFICRSKAEESEAAA